MINTRVVKNIRFRICEICISDSHFRICYCN